MFPCVSPRRSSRNIAPTAVLAPATFVVIASRIVTADRLEVVLRGEHAGTFDGAKRHAVTLLAATAARFGRACVDVTDAAGIPVFAVSTAGGAS